MKLVIKVLSKTMDSTTLSPEKVELATLSRDEDAGKVRAVRALLCSLLQPHTAVGSHERGGSGVQLAPPAAAVPRPRGCDADDAYPPCCAVPAAVSAVRAVQVVYKVYEDAELKPILDAVNAEQSKEKEKESS